MKEFLKGLLIACCLVSPAMAADFSTNGTAAGAIEGLLESQVLPKEVQDFAFFLYQQGRTFNQGVEITSSDPKPAFFERHQKLYCSPNISAEVTAFACKGVGGSLTATEAQYMELGDVKASVLLEPSVYTAALDLAAQNYIRNLVQPFPDYKYQQMIKLKSFLKDSKQQEEYTNFIAKQSTMGAALYALNDIYTRRLPLNGGRSLISVMEDETTRRFQQPDFNNTIMAGGITQTALLQEMAKMQAVSLWMDYQAFKQNERIEALLAATLAKSAGGLAAGLPGQY